VAHEWLTELLMFQLFRATGLGGLIFIFAAILNAAFILLYLRCGPSPYIAGAATLCAALATRPVWGVRPQVVSLLFTSLWLLLLDRSEKNSRILWWTLPLTLLWVNLHAGFALGLVLLGLFLLGESIEAVLRMGPGSPCVAPRDWKTAAFVLLLDILLVPLNPNGFRLFSYPIETLRSAAMKNYIVEWASPNFHRAEYAPFLVIILATILTLHWSRIPVRPRDLILLCVGLYAGLSSIRLIPLFVLIAVPIISRRLGTWPVPDKDPRKIPALAQMLNASILTAMAVFAGAHLAQVIERQPQVQAGEFPERAVAFLMAHPPSGAIFNHYDWGGYLIWNLYPSTRVFLDGRADLYGEHLFREFADAYQLQGSWRQILQNWKVQTVIVPTTSPLATGLRDDAGWKITYQDNQAIILTASPPTLPSPAPASPPSHPR